MTLPNIELVASKVHDAWWEEKKKQGFHAPLDCISNNHLSFVNSPEHGKERFADAGFNEKLYQWCTKCHPDMYPYGELSDNIKEYDRVTVKTVYKAINDLTSR